jgi:FHS family L-fucose permease-like MFS transporter
MDSNTGANGAAGQAGSVRAAFIAVTTLFFAWGLITSLIDPLVAAVKGIFTLTDVEAQLSASAFFIAYGLISFPAATLIARVRPVPAILLALATMVAACLVMLLAANVANYTLVLAGLFLLASGITVLQVAANPLAAALGAPERSHFRLTLAQTFNSMGTFIGPYVGAVLFLEGLEVKAGTVVTQAARDNALLGIDRAYFWICGLLALLLVFFLLARRTVSAAAPTPAPAEGLGAMVRDAVSSRWALLGGAAIFLYVGAEVSIGTQMALLLNDDGVWGVSLQDAGKFVSFYWGGAMVGRIIGSALLARIDAGRLLAAFAAAACLMCLFVVAVGGIPGGYVALAIGLANSIMFPVIFTLTLERSTARDEATSGLLCTAIVGGAALPLVTGAVSGASGYITALLVPAACYALLCLFAFAASRTAPARKVEGPTLH